MFGPKWLPVKKNTPAVGACYRRNNPNERGGILLKIDGDGKKIWKKYMHDVSGKTVFNDMIVLADGSIVITGESNSLDKRASLMKFDETGELLWKRDYEYNPAAKERLDALIRTSDGGFCMGGQAFPILDTIASNASDCWIIKVDSLGLVTELDEAKNVLVIGPLQQAGLRRGSSVSVHRDGRGGQRHLLRRSGCAPNRS